MELSCYFKVVLCIHLLASFCIPGLLPTSLHFHNSRIMKQVKADGGLSSCKTGRWHSSGCWENSVNLMKAQTKMRHGKTIFLERTRDSCRQSNTGTVSKATLGKLLRNKVEHIWAFLSTQILSSTELDKKKKITPWESSKHSIFTQNTTYSCLSPHQLMLSAGSQALEWHVTWCGKLPVSWGFCHSQPGLHRTITEMYKKNYTSKKTQQTNFKKIKPWSKWHDKKLWFLFGRAKHCTNTNCKNGIL